MTKIVTVSTLSLAGALITQTQSQYQPLQTSILISIIGYHVTTTLIPRCTESFINAGLKGKDLSKRDMPIIAETIGVIPLITYIFLMFCFIPFMFLKFLIIDTSGGGNREIGNLQISNLHWLFPHDKLSSYLSGMLSLESMILLGLMDDLFDIRWRHKFFLPAIAAIPLLIVYYIDFGVTSILIPNFIKNWFNLPFHNIDLGVGYYFYMASVLIFCPNSVNILAGVNGLEVGQTVVLTLLLLLNDFCYLVPLDSNYPAYESHLFSSCILIPFLGVALGLLRYNWFPSRVFVGDTWCYFSGMVFAIVGILGHFSKTLMLFFIPQIFNFIYSVPQLFGIIPCPRHRLPRFEHKDGLMYVSQLTITKPLPPIITRILKLLEVIKLISLEVDSNNVITKCNNLTLINLVLVWFGPMREDKLCITLMSLQFMIGILCLLGRHLIGQWLFGYDNLQWPV